MVRNIIISKRSYYALNEAVQALGTQGFTLVSMGQDQGGDWFAGLTMTDSVKKSKKIFG